MEVEFECGCGEQIEEFTRGESREFDKRIQCDECGSVYAVTLTELRTEYEDPF